HCKTPRGQHHELRESSYYGNPVVELLKDGEPIQSHDEHFRFGIEKALLILASLRVIEQFVELGDDAITSPPQQVVDAKAGQIQVWVEMHPDFVHSSGASIDRPWLRMEYLPLGTGAHRSRVRESKAILALSKD